MHILILIIIVGEYSEQGFFKHRLKRILKESYYLCIYFQIIHLSIQLTVGVCVFTMVHPRYSSHHHHNNKTSYSWSVVSLCHPTTVMNTRATRAAHLTLAELLPPSLGFIQSARLRIPIPHIVPFTTSACH